MGLGFLGTVLPCLAHGVEFCHGIRGGGDLALAGTSWWAGLRPCGEGLGQLPSSLGQDPACCTSAVLTTLLFALQLEFTLSTPPGRLPLILSPQRPFLVVGLTALSCELGV